MMWDELQQKREMSAFKGTHFVTQRKTTKRITRTTLCTPLPPQEGKKKKSSTLTKHEVKKAHFRQEGFFTDSSFLHTSRRNANQSNTSRSYLKGCATNDKYSTTC